MFEKEIKFIADFNLNKIKNFGSFILFEKFQNSDVHPAIKQYISAELDYLIHEDRKKLLEKSVFDYSGAEVGKYFNAIAQEVKKNKRISFEDIKKLILQAVSFNVNYLVRPRWSLTKLVYNESETKSVDEIKLNLNYVYFFEHVKNILVAYLSKRNIFSLSATEFEIILDKIDKEIFSSDERKILDYTLYTMAEFLNTGATDKTILPPVAVELFLKEKNQIDKVIRLRKHYPDGSKQSVGIEDIKRIIYSNEPMEYEIPGPEVEETPAEIEEETNPELPDIEEIKLEEIELEEISGEETEPDHDVAEDDTELAEEPKETEIKDTTEDIEPEAEAEFEIPAAETGDTAEKPLDEEEIPEIKDEEKTNSQEAGNPEDKIISEEIDSGSETELDDSFLAYYESELKSLEEDISDLSVGENQDDELKSIEEDLTELDTGEIKVNESEELEDLFEFEEDPDDLMKEFSAESEIKSEKPEEPELAAEEELNIEESEELTREFLSGDDLTDESEENTEFGEEEFDEEELDEINSEETEIPRRRREDDLFDYLSNKDIEKIVANVFNDDREDFAGTMEKISECASYEEATEILKSVFLTYRVNPYSKEAVILTNSVSNYFEQG